MDRQDDLEYEVRALLLLNQKKKLLKKEKSSADSLEQHVGIIYFCKPQICSVCMCHVFHISVFCNSKQSDAVHISRIWADFVIKRGTWWSHDAKSQTVIQFLVQQTKPKPNQTSNATFPHHKTDLRNTENFKLDGEETQSFNRSETCPEIEQCWRSLGLMIFSRCDMTLFRILVRWF